MSCPAVRYNGGLDSRIVGHGLEDGIVELNGSGNEQSGMGRLGRHGGQRGLRGSRCS